ncbi:MAG: hypothetical protein HS113_24025 [Verrucomicrobiales bacterium]|nr:hypothetical protein [Verrucomicrobiales bacterium]
MVRTAEAVYVALDVVDDLIVTDLGRSGSENRTTWEDDSVEVFFDADLSPDQDEGRS